VVISDGQWASKSESMVSGWLVKQDSVVSHHDWSVSGHLETPVVIAGGRTGPDG